VRRPRSPAALALALACCRPELGERESLVTGTRILAVRGEPAEARPSERVHLSLLVAGPDGAVPGAAASWALCTTPKLLTENGAASAACLGSSGGATPIGDGAEIDATIPTDACALFGPEVTSPDLRPRDPDVTGGHYQPFRVAVAATDGQPVVAFALQRIACRLAGASAAVAAEHARLRTPNENPVLAPVTILLDGSPLARDAIPRGAAVTLRASWPEASAERHVVHDVVAGALAWRREALRVSWFATAGSFEHDRTGRAEDDPETFTENVWTAPADARATHVFVVLRDGRGGVAFETLELATR
jgi:hypothetical protein